MLALRQEGREWRARPAYVSYRSHEGAAVRVAAALQRGSEGLALSSFDLSERQLPGLAEQAGEFEDVVVGVERRGVVVVDGVKVFALGEPIGQFQPACLALDRRLGIQERDQDLACLDFWPAEKRERVLAEGERRGCYTAPDHFSPCHRLRGHGSGVNRNGRAVEFGH